MRSYALLSRRTSSRLIRSTFVALLLVSVCCAHAQQGHVKGAGYPVAGSHDYLFAASTSGANTAPISLLHGAGVTIDAAGNGYVTSDSNGYFYIAGLYAAYCPTPNSLVYMLGVGGNTGYGGNNPASVFVTAFAATCSNLPNAPFIFLSEATTAAAAAALSSFANVSTDSFASSPANAAALANAFAYASTLVNGYYGNVLPNAPYAKINTLADIMSECVNTTDTMPCATLFATVTPPGGTAPTDTFQAMLDIALYPTNNASLLYSFYASVSNDQFYTPTLTAAPVTWALLPPITWPAPVPISYGTALSTTQLDATTIVPGTFTYTPAIGTVLGVGNQTLSVAFTPTDPTSYEFTTATINLAVGNATLVCPVTP